MFVFMGLVSGVNSIKIRQEKQGGRERKRITNEYRKKWERRKEGLNGAALIGRKA